MKNTLEFRQQDNKYGTCECYLNNKFVDQCDMNWKEKYTQAHIVLASAYRTLQTRDIDIIITGSAKVGQYPIDKIKGMSHFQINEDFSDRYGMTRIYSL